MQSEEKTRKKETGKNITGEALLLWSPCFIAGFAYKEGQSQGRPLSKSA